MILVILERDVALPVAKIPSLCLIWNSWLLMNISGLEQVKHHTDDPVVLDIVSMHHEYLNGTGYPNGCRAEDIPPHVRLVSIANSLCAYLENTQHTSSDSTPMLMAELLDYLHNEAISGKYDITLLNAFFDGIMSYYDSLIPLRNGLRDYCSEKG